MGTPTAGLRRSPPPAAPLSNNSSSSNNKPIVPTCPAGKLFHYEESIDAFLFDLQPQQQEPILVADAFGNVDADVSVPLAPCLYRLTDYTFAKHEPVLRSRCILKLGVLRCFWNECQALNQLLWNRFSASASFAVAHTLPELPSPRMQNPQSTRMTTVTTSIEEDELGKARFMELLSNCGVYQKVSELILQRTGQVSDSLRRQGHRTNPTGNSHNPYRIPQIQVKGLEAFLQALEDLTFAYLTRVGRAIGTTR